MAWLELVDFSPPDTGHQREQQKPLLAWFYSKFTVPEHTQLSKCPYNLAYNYSDLDKPQVRWCHRNVRAAWERANRTPAIAYKTDASPVCQHRLYKRQSTKPSHGQLSILEQCCFFFS